MEGVFAIAFPFIMIILITWLKSRERQARYRMQSDLYVKTLEKGHSVTFPEQIFAEPEKKQKRNGALKAGLICIAVGVAVSLVLWLMGYSFGNSELPKAESVSEVFMILAYLGILPFMVGVAFMIIHLFEKKQNAGGKAQ